MTLDDQIETMARAYDPVGWRWYDAADLEHPARPIFRANAIDRMLEAYAALLRLSEKG